MYSAWLKRFQSLLSNDFGAFEYVRRTNLNRFQDTEGDSVNDAEEVEEDLQETQVDRQEENRY